MRPRSVSRTPSRLITAALLLAMLVPFAGRGIARSEDLAGSSYAASSVQLRSLHVQEVSRSTRRMLLTICIDRPASAGGVAIALSSDRPEIVPVPATSTVPAGYGCVQVRPLIAMISTYETVTFTATLNSHSLTGSTEVRPLQPQVHTQPISRAGGFSKLTICLGTRYFNVETDIPVSSDHPDAFPVPAIVTFADAEACKSLIIPVGAVNTDTLVTISATFESGVRTGTTLVRNLPPATLTPIPSATFTPSRTPTVTPRPTRTPTRIVTRTATPVRTPTRVVTPKPTRTPTATPIPPLPVLNVYTGIGTRGGGLARVEVCVSPLAPAGGTTVSLSSDRPDVVPVPATVRVSPGHYCVRLRQPVAAVTESVVVTFTVSGGTGPASATTLVRPAHPIVYTQPVSRAGGQSKVTVCKADSSSPYAIQLTSSNPTVFPVPELVFTDYPSSCVSVVVQVGSVSEDTEVIITAVSGSPPVTRTGSTIVRNLDPTPTVTDTPVPTDTAVAIDTAVPTDTATPVPTAAETETAIPVATQSPTVSVP